jgi:hypothetical protein
MRFLHTVLWPKGDVKDLPQKQQFKIPDSMLNGNMDDLVKNLLKGGFAKSSRCKAAKVVGAIHESPLRVRRNDEVEAQRRRWTFYEVINLAARMNKLTRGCSKVTC